jgi:glycerol kinase
VQWLRDELGFVEHSKDIEKLAASVLDSNGVMLVPAFTGLGAPYWDPDARGTIVGLTRGASKAHIARAALESIAFQSAEVLDDDRRLKLGACPAGGRVCPPTTCSCTQADLLAYWWLRPTC